MAELGEQLGEVIRRAIGSDATIESWERGPVGNGQEAWFCEVSSGGKLRSVVVRRTAVSGPLQWTDRQAEFAALRWLEPHAVLSPPVLHFEPEGGALERAAIVMERMPGRPLGRESDDTKRTLAADLGRRLAALHAVDASDFPGGGHADIGAANAAQVAFWADRYESDALEPVPLVAGLLAWMEANPPERSGPPSVVWGDCGLHNLLHDDGAIAALLDWELVHIGDPLEDLGAAVWSAAGVVDIEVIIASYEAAAEVRIGREQLRWQPRRPTARHPEHGTQQEKT